MRTRSLLLVAAATLIALAGCAQAGSRVGAPVESGSAPSSTGSSSGSPSASLPGGPSVPPSKGVPSGQSITVTGTVQAGVEHGCLVLRTDTVQYLLLDGDPAVVKDGAKLTVTGVVRKDVMSYCMQGVPLEVERAVPA